MVDEKTKEFLRDDCKAMISIFLLIAVIIKAVFTKESLLSVVRIVGSYFWMFFIPGYVLMLNWRKHLDFFTRFIAGTGFAIVFTTLMDYYLGIIGIGYNIRIVSIPILMIFASALLHRKDFPINKTED